MNRYIKHSIEQMEYYLSKSDKLVTYSAFNETIKNNLPILKQMHDDINIITPLTLSFFKIYEIGHIMHTFYQFYDNKSYTDAILYSFGFNGYIHLLTGLKRNIDSFNINKATFSLDYHVKKDLKKKKKEKGTFKKMYYPKFIEHRDMVYNDCTLDKNIIITGPNASGKTTILKSVLINLILSQQTGFGCFESLDFYPYDNFHCYLNIPDTSGRDSLFQAEARRCKEIMDCINIKCAKEETHFCIFDEIYSGTNPEEAVSSAKQFMKNIVKNDNVSCLLTTHYVKLCKKLAKNSRIINCHMKTKKKEINEINETNLIKDDFDYTYKMEEGISTVKGGTKVIQSTFNDARGHPKVEPNREPKVMK
jgi:DNA mismatch repair ATPase MutS